MKPLTALATLLVEVLLLVLAVWWGVTFGPGMTEQDKVMVVTWMAGAMMLAGLFAVAGLWWRLRR